jgi:hypothetical protein
MQLLAGQEHDVTAAHAGLPSLGPDHTGAEPPGRLLWLPSQNGALPVCLQPQKMTSTSRGAWKATGA